MAFAREAVLSNATVLLERGGGLGDGTLTVVPLFFVPGVAHRVCGTTGLWLVFREKVVSQCRFTAFLFAFPLVVSCR